MKKAVLPIYSESGKPLHGNNFRLALILVISLFFMWAVVNGLNGILIRHFKNLLQLNRGQAGFVDTSFYLGYFIMALPAGLWLRRYGYKNGIVFGLFLFAAGAFLFYPAAIIKAYWFFLLALFIIAGGLTFLETAANPYVTILGNSETAERRLNFAQAFNGLGWVIAAYAGGKIILGRQEQFTGQMNALLPGQLSKAEAAIVQQPYLYIGFAVLLLMLLFYRTPMPEVKTTGTNKKINWHLLQLHKQLRLGVIAQFFYVGAQAGIWGYFLFYVKECLPAIPESTCSTYYTIGFVLFMTGRFAGTLLMKYFRPATLLAVYAVINILLILVSLSTTGYTAVFVMLAVSYFMSIMYPTLFVLSIKGTEPDSKIASSFMVMAIIGGALFPPVMGYLSEWTGIIKYSYLLPLISFIVILYYAVAGHRITPITQERNNMQKNPQHLK